MSFKICHHDLETRSRVDLRTCGAHRYAIDPSFEILMCGFAWEDSEDVKLWVNPKYRTPDFLGDNEEVEEGLRVADEIYAHNLPFELACTWAAEEREIARPIWNHSVLLSKGRCTAAMARKAGLPGSLDKLGEALNLGVQKDKRGKELIAFFCTPRDDGEFNNPKEHLDKWVAFCEYCKTDVRTEQGAHRKMKDFELQGSALQTFQFDLRMNQRGIPINIEAAKNAQSIVAEKQAGVAEEFRRLTGLNPTQGEKFKTWLAVQGLTVPNLQAETVADLLKQSISPGSEATRQALGMYQSLSYAAVKKLQTMLSSVCPDGFIRGTFVYYGASTGRWSAQRLQPHNFRNTDPEYRPAYDLIYSAVRNGITAEGLDAVYGSPLECLANIIRAFIHHPKYELLDGDYAAIEARIICWLAGQDDVLQKWAKGEDMYRWMASQVYDIPIEQVTKDQREVGKRVILGCGYQMGWKKFQSSCDIQYGLKLPDGLCERCVTLFRKLCSKIREYWYTLQRDALTAIKTKQSRGAFSIRRTAGIEFLTFRLRSGRSLVYPHPKIELEAWSPDKAEDDDPTETPEVRYREQITYWGEIRHNIWGRVKLYGGKLAENETQATAADIMAHGAITAESRGMPPFMLVHDQGVALRAGGQTAEEYSEALATLPPWAVGLPVKVKSEVLKFWKKG